MIYGYLRVSTADQGENGVSLDAQQGEILASARGRPVQWVKDVCSGSIEFKLRPGGAYISENLNRNDMIIAVKLDRLFRDTGDALATIERWGVMGVDVTILNLGGSTVDTRSPIGKMFFTLIAAFAEFERALIRERTRAALQHQKSIGKSRTSLRPFGYDIDEDRNTFPRDDEQILLNKMIYLKCHGSKTRDIAKFLNDLEVKAPSGCVWDHGMVGRVLTNEIERRSRADEMRREKPIAAPGH